jgi:DNA-directed RNA polymerase subunit RPC12/RpoP
MPSETFYCPHCKRQLTKSAQAYVLGEILKSKAPFMGLGGMAPYVSCPGCGGRIDSMKMVKGEYDFNSVDGWTVLLIIAAVIIFKFVFHWSWVAAIIIGLISGVLLIQILSEFFKGKKKGGSIYD